MSQSIKSFLIALLLLGTHGNLTMAYAQRMQDYSMSPEESLQQPDISGSQPSNYNQFIRGAQQPQQHSPIGAIGGNVGAVGQAGLPSAASANSFMAGFCDPGFRPAVAATTGVQACIEQQRQNACQEFQRLPQEVQDVIDRSISCAYIAASGEAPSDNAGCANENAARLELLKKYASDPLSNHALIFMQDSVLNPSANCAGGY